MFVIDRFETDLAVIELEGKTFNLPQFLLPPGAKEGDVLDIKINVDEQQTIKRTKEIAELEKEVFKDEV